MKLKSSLGIDRNQLKQVTIEPKVEQKQKDEQTDCNWSTHEVKVAENAN